MTHLKRNKIGTFWDIPRKGTKYLAVAKHNKKDSVPLVVVIRDNLKLVRNKKELKRLLNEKQILVNKKEVREVNYPIGLFDILTFPRLKKNYKAVLSKNKKMIFEEIEDKDSGSKVYKINGIKTLKNNKIQLNLSSGKNILSNEKLKIGDSILIDLKSNKILKKLPLEKDRKVFVIRGRHTGVEGNIKDILKEGNKTIVEINSDNKIIKVWTKNLIVIG